MAGVVTRFAPSPTGPLHLGHAFSALTAAARGQMLLRIEDIDRARCRAGYEAAIYDDLRWLGLDWPRPVLRQSDRLADYAGAIHRLTALGVTYACTCTRGDIKAALSAPQEGAIVIGPDGPVYPGTCRGRHQPPTGVAIRLDMAAAMALAGPLTFAETGSDHAGPHHRNRDQMVETVGDIVLARRDIGTSYHIAVVVDDAAQGVTEVVRGADLFEATAIHVLLQRLLGLPLPQYHHHRLIRDAQGKRLAKRDDARALATFRAEGATPQDIRRLVGL
ncbi:tRNA glutamyl-Q(34) synthetase GluQRS [Gemmobacter fulvus]|uniref:tRNA glutamyl-Q(34) synthetase GluQRS n=1 Tax=Gemmobacter fulvus TaxID=2840474 RepID=A0A975P6I5_9RHOB|nr:tRNA glutamyl-Q(34) synthetase GluQRS [Gemmobacter fulvus]MBT9245373.1 tRNA glutamyl-Q(34) synthetase GluQRS [Gemmobacter fulvus]QWK90312.1 tRNA glutamyl-Q(34) synthetase GluQRS [Gemmobacter fulvus]